MRVVRVLPVIACLFLVMVKPAFAADSDDTKICVVEEKVASLFGRSMHRIDETECIKESEWGTLLLRIDEFLAVARTNAESVNRWFVSTGIARSGGLTISPESCDNKSDYKILMDCALDSLQSTFAKFTNVFDEASDSPAIIMGRALDLSDGFCAKGGKSLSVWLDDDGAQVGRYDSAYLYGSVVVDTNLYQKIGGTHKATFKVGYCDHEARFIAINEDGLL